VAVPSREVVGAYWRDLLAGRRSREEVHGWAKPWVEDLDALIKDPIVRIGLQHLHGFDASAAADGPASLQRHGGGAGRVYVQAEADIRAALERWLAHGVAFDADPQAWRASRLQQARQAIRDAGY
jgi:hypothetical protein